MDDARELFGVWFHKRTGRVRRWYPPIGMTEEDAATMQRVTETLPKVVEVDAPTEKIQVDQPTQRLRPGWFGGVE